MFLLAELLYFLTIFFLSLQTEESEARKELRAMIQTYLAEEIKKVKLTVEEQLKSTEETLGKKIEAAETAGKKSPRKESAKKKKWDEFSWKCNLSM